MRGDIRTLALLACIVLIPTAALAQAVIAGTVRDSSGAVLPGVTVEAASPALIEKVRSAVTDGTGQYRIEDLRPGTYTVTFTLPGFNTFRREGIELTGSFTATVNAELNGRRRSTETITVTGESPVVDVQSARREITLNNDVLRSIPTRAQLQRPGRRRARRRHQPERHRHRNGHDAVSHPRRPQQRRPHDDRRAQHRQSAVGGNQPPRYMADIGNAQEVTFTTSGGLGEAETAGLVMNVVPKTGGNTISGAVYFSGTGENAAVRQLHAGAQGCRPRGANAVHQGVRPQWGVRRSDQEGSRVVLRERAHAGQHDDGCEHLLQPECRRPDEVDLRPGPEPAGVLGPHLGERERACHLAGHPAQQDRRLLGRAADLPEVHGDDPGHHGSRAGHARGHRRSVRRSRCA